MIDESKLDKKLLNRQKKAVEKWRRNVGRGSVVGPTGFGKTFVGLLAADYMIRNNPEKSALVIVPSNIIKDQWEELIRKYELDKNIIVMVVNSAYKINTYSDLIIFDEVHRFAAPVFKKCFEIPHKFVLGLTASYERKDGLHEFLEEKVPIVDEVTIKEALENDWVSDYTVYNLDVELSEEEEKKIKDYTKSFNDYFSTFEFDFNLAMKCLNDKEAAKYSKQLPPQYSPNTVKIQAVQFVKTMKKRKELLYNNDSKYEMALKTIEQFPDEKLITFSQSIGMANLLTDSLNQTHGSNYSASYHSKMGKKHRAAVLEKFNNGEIKILNTANALDEGFDVEDLDRAIVVSNTSEPRQLIQRLGRLLRRKKDKHAKLVYLYTKGTQDEKWMKKAQKFIPSHKKKFIDHPEEISIVDDQSLELNS